MSGNVVDLWRIKKMLGQKLRRAISSGVRPEMHEKLAKAVDIQEKIIRQHLAKKSIRKLVEQLDRLERNTRRGAPYGNGILRALDEGEVICKISPVKIHQYIRPREPGYIYVFTSKSDQSKHKIGVTTKRPQIRLKEFQNKYKAAVNLSYSIGCESVHLLDSELKAGLANHCINAVTAGESNEWYQIPLDNAKEIIQRVIEG